MKPGLPIAAMLLGAASGGCFVDDIVAERLLFDGGMSPDVPDVGGTEGCPGLSPWPAALFSEGVRLCVLANATASAPLDVAGPVDALVSLAVNAGLRGDRLYTGELRSGDAVSVTSDAFIERELASDGPVDIGGRLWVGDAVRAPSMAVGGDFVMREGRAIDVGEGLREPTTRVATDALVPAGPRCDEAATLEAVAEVLATVEDAPDVAANTIDGSLSCGPTRWGQVRTSQLSLRLDADARLHLSGGLRAGSVRIEGAHRLEMVVRGSIGVGSLEVDGTELRLVTDAGELPTRIVLTGGARLDVVAPSAFATLPDGIAGQAALLVRALNASGPLDLR